MFDGLTIGQAIVVIASIILGVSFHEAMHGFAAHALGDDTAQLAGRLTLNPLKHIDIYTTILLPIVMLLIFHVPFLAAKPVPFNPTRLKYREYGAAIVGIAGPLSNLVLAGLAALVLHIFSGSITQTVGFDIYLFMYVNVAMFVFNMIPFPPLDGSRLLYAFAPEPLQRVMYRIESAGFTSIIFIVIIFFLFLSTFIISIDTHLVNFLLS